MQSLTSSSHRTIEANHSPRGFTIVEMLVVIAIVGLLAGLAFPVFSSVRERAGATKCASNLRQLGMAVTNYLAIYHDHLPQVAVPVDKDGNLAIIGTLFGGKKGQLPYYGINEWGANERPLNKFLGGGDMTDEEMALFECPLDRGQPPNAGDPDNPYDDFPNVDSMYDFVGTSYTLNDHSLDSEQCHTLVPGTTGDKPGGKMPRIQNPTKTWVIGDLIIYNYQEMGDRGQRWHHHDTICNLCFLDGHVEQGIQLEPSEIGPNGFIQQNTTSQYTFLPSDGWLEKHCGQ